MPDANRLLTTSQIAGLAGVTVGTVSNWRKRYADTDNPFPDPVLEGGGRKRFRYGDVVEWLTKNRGPVEGADPEVPEENVPGENAREVRRTLEDINETIRDVFGPEGKRPKTSPDLALIVGDLVTRRLTADDPGRFEQEEGRLPPVAKDELERVRGTYARVRPELTSIVDTYWAASDNPEASLAELFEGALDFERPTRAGQSSAGSIAELVAAISVDEPASDEVRRVFDPAAGEASFFTAIAVRRRRDGAPVPRFLGIDIAPRPLLLAWQRSIVHDFECELRLGDSLDPDNFPFGELFPLIVCNPVFGGPPGKKSGTSREKGVAGPRGRELAWAELCMTHLTPGGRALLVVPRRALVSGGAERAIRGKLVDSGKLEAVISLPPGALEHDPGDSALLVIAGPGDRANGGRILFIDLSDRSPEEISGEGATWLGKALKDWRTRGTPPDGEAGRGAVQPVGKESVYDDGGERASVSLLPSEWIPDIVDEATLKEIRQGLDAAPERLAASLNRAREVLGPLSSLSFFEHDGEGPQWTKLRELIDNGSVELLRPLPQSRGRSRPNSARLEAGARASWPAWKVNPSTRRPTVDEVLLPTGETEPADRYLTRPGDVIVNPVAGTRFGSITAELDTEGGRVITHPLQGLRVAEDSIDRLSPAVLRAALESERNRPRQEEERPGVRTPPGRVRIQELEVPNLDPVAAGELQEALRQADEMREAARDLADATSAMFDGLLEFRPSGSPRG